MEEKTEAKEKSTFDILQEQTEGKMKELANEGVKRENIDYLGKLADFQKDLLEIKTRKEEKEMRYGNEYGDSYGRGYRGYGTEGYGRRGVPGTGRGRYRGEEALDEMKYHYGNYQDSYNTGNYNAKEDSSYKMTEAFKEFIYAVGQELEPKDKQMFKQAMQEMVQKLN